ncbi:MAG: aminopeptidase P N-terminal domain-containing protein [Clostridiales bacterium]|nr:aminopeptidase P N-terminal domain-containing protein [Clostridia bacterium]MCD8056010.1 aminopeptidase P N-terminal domain-containing protein [Clostridiales bacterium]
MKSSFYSGNRQTLYSSLPEDTLLIVYAGSAIRKTADEDYPVYIDTNFLYLTGIEQRETVLFAVKTNGETKETIFSLPPDFMVERWTGKRLKPDAITEISGCTDVKSTDELDEQIKAASRRVRYLAVDIDDLNAKNPTQAAFLSHVREICSSPAIYDVRPQLRRQRTIKAPCEIEAMREACDITRDGIIAMMKASKPGMYEYQYKAHYDSALLMRGCREPAFPSIISAGENNFCIHYYSYTGQSKDGDMILNDVGAKYDHMHCDISRGWPCNGKYTDRQRALYNCALSTSNHMFEILKPGMPHRFVDEEIHRYCGTLLCDVGILDKWENNRKYMWHNGAHHIGFDTHDMVAPDDVILPGMVFAVDVGIYVEEWGIGFRVEETAHVTETGVEDLSKSVPRDIDEIEALMS